MTKTKKTQTPPADSPAIVAIAAAPKLTLVPAAKAPTKIQIIVDLLRRPQGAMIGDLVGATGWQAHSVRGALAGHIKKKLGLNIISDKTEAGRVYRVAAGEPAA